MMLKHLAILTVTLLTTTVLGAIPRVAKVIDVAPAWSGHPVGFSLITRGDRQYVGFYAADRKLTIASRSLDSDRWTMKVLPTSVGWDSHNYIEMTFDDAGQLHVAANMHAVPLIYFRTTKAGQVESLERVDSMVGPDEAKCTYPRFFRGPKNELIFTYRDGSSGDGNQIYNVYDLATQKWSRLLDEPLTDGEGQRNAYLTNFVRGPDGYFHLAWVWREEPDCATNHDLSYARSKDLKSWESAAGNPLKLPITLATADIVDPVPVRRGMINGNVAVGFDSKKRAIVSYHKFDAAGNTQVYNARFENGAWKIYQTSDWTYRWDFSGGGTIPFEIRIAGVRLGTDGKLTQSFSHDKLGGAAVWTLDEATLKPTATTRPATNHAPELDQVKSDFPGMSVRWQGDTGGSPRPGVSYQIRWETLGINRDRPRPEPWPAPTLLRVYEFQSSDPTAERR